MTDRPMQPDPRRQPSPAENIGLQRAALRHRIKTILDREIDPASTVGEGSVVAAAVDGRAIYQTGDRRGLGPAMHWAAANGCDALTVIAEAAVAGDLARRAGLFDSEIDVFSADGPDVEPAVPTEVPTPPTLPSDHLRFAGLISDAGARAIDDHGMLIAEVAGLEVARVIDDPLAPEAARRAKTAAGTGPWLAVGVGQADRELQQYVNGHLDDDTNLRRAVAVVARHRRSGSLGHPLARLARQRWLRSLLLDDPSVVGLDDLEAVPPLRPRTTLLGTEPAAATGQTCVVVCSVGVDLDLLPEAVDYRHRIDPAAELLVVVPERDRRLSTAALGPMVPRSQVLSIDVPWEVPGPGAGG